jgi:hypothetical protein
MPKVQTLKTLLFNQEATSSAPDKLDSANILQCCISLVSSSALLFGNVPDLPELSMIGL